MTNSEHELEFTFAKNEGCEDRGCEGKQIIIISP